MPAGFAAVAGPGSGLGRRPDLDQVAVGVPDVAADLAGHVLGRGDEVRPARAEDLHRSKPVTHAAKCASRGTPGRPSEGVLREDRVRALRRHIGGGAPRRAGVVGSRASPRDVVGGGWCRTTCCWPVVGSSIRSAPTNAATGAATEMLRACDVS
jgi:hypothetical protein